MEIFLQAISLLLRGISYLQEMAVSLWNIKDLRTVPSFRGLDQYDFFY